MLKKSSANGSILATVRSSRPEVFCKKGVLENFAGKHLCQSLFLNKVAGLRCFPVNFTKFSRSPFFTEHLRWLLLNGPKAKR